MLHCIDGAHRAGSAGISYMMRGGRISFKNALTIGTRLRPVIDPFGDLAELLTRFEAAQEMLGYETFNKLSYVKEHVVGFKMCRNILSFTFDGE